MDRWAVDVPLFKQTQSPPKKRVIALRFFTSCLYVVKYELVELLFWGLISKRNIYYVTARQNFYCWIFFLRLSLFFGLHIRPSLLFIKYLLHHIICTFNVINWKLNVRSYDNNRFNEYSIVCQMLGSITPK